MAIGDLYEFSSLGSVFCRVSVDLQFSWRVKFIGGGHVEMKNPSASMPL